MKKRWLLLTCLCLCPATLLAGDDLPPPPKVGELPPQLLGKNGKGDPVDLANYRDKVTIVTY